MSSHRSKNRAAFFKIKENRPEFIQSAEFNACARKRKYETERIAQKDANSMMNEYGGFLRPYKCKFCKKYHLTSQEKKHE